MTNEEYFQLFKTVFPDFAAGNVNVLDAHSIKMIFLRRKAPGNHIDEFLKHAVAEEWVTEIPDDVDEFFWNITEKGKSI